MRAKLAGCPVCIILCTQSESCVGLEEGGLSDIAYSDDHRENGSVGNLIATVAENGASSPWWGVAVGRRGR